MTNQPSAQTSQFKSIQDVTAEITPPTTAAPRLTVDDILPEWQRPADQKGRLTAAQQKEKKANAASRATIQAMLDQQAETDRKLAEAQASITGLQREARTAVGTLTSVRAEYERLNSRVWEVTTENTRLTRLVGEIPVLLITASRLAAEGDEYVSDVTISSNAVPTVSYQLGGHRVVQTTGHNRELRLNPSSSDGVTFKLTAAGMSDRQTDSLQGYLTKDETSHYQGVVAVCQEPSCTRCARLVAEIGRVTTKAAYDAVMERYSRDGVHADLVQLADTLLEHIR